MLVDLAINLFCKDHVRTFEFYRALLAAPEMTEHASPIYRGLQLPGCSLGFHAQDAYALLDLEDLRGAGPAPGHYPTFNLDSTHAVDEMLQRALALGATLKKGPFRTYYNAYQVVLLDPELAVFRLNHYMIGAGA